MARRIKPWYLSLYIGPSGPNWLDIRVHREKPDIRALCKAEGTGMLFKLVDWDAGSKQNIDAIANMPESYCVTAKLVKKKH